MRVVLVVAAALVLCPAASALEGRVVADSFSSPALHGRLSFDVYLPAGYDGSTTRYPVVYYLHGLPAGPRAYTTFGYVAQAIDALGGQAIVVAPQGARDGDTDPEYLDWGPGRGWETALAVELPRVVDHRYRTIAARAGRAIVGVSAGGYGAMTLGLHHLDEYAAIESWSGYFHPTDPTGTKALQRELTASPLNLVPELRASPVAERPFIAFYVGAGDTRFRHDNVLFARELSRAGVAFTFRMYPGGHQQNLWTAQAAPWLALTLAHLDQPT